MTSWTRPECLPYPSVWADYTGRRELQDGHIPYFRIQDAPEEMFDEIIEHMNTFFLKDEPICSTSGFAKDPVSVQEFNDLWRTALRARTVLVALEVCGDRTTKLAGVNMTVVLTNTKKDDVKLKGVQMQKVMGLVEMMSSLADVFKIFGVTEYLSALGLSVAPEYRGQGLGLEILKTRVPFCKALGLKVTSTVFTADNSQELARRLGFEVVARIYYRVYTFNRVSVFPRLDEKQCKTMALRIE